MEFRGIVLAGAASLMAAACTNTGTVERNTFGGAAIGAAAGAIIGEATGDRAGRGAAIGAALGGAAGAIKGCADTNCFGRARDQGRRYYDQRAGDYYYVDPVTGDTYWEDGTVRTYGRGGRRR